MLNFLLLCLTLGASSLAYAVDTKYLLINGKAFHLDSPGVYNEENYGVGLEVTSREGRITKGVTGSVLLDSYGKPSGYVGYLWKYRAIDSAIGVDVGAIGGLMMRDNIRHYTPFPFVLPAASVSYGRAMVNITYIPNLPSLIKDGQVVFLQFAWRL